MESFNEDRIKHLLAKHLMKDLAEDESMELDQWRKLSSLNEDLYQRMSDPAYLEKRYSDFTKATYAAAKGKKSSGRIWWRWGILAAAAVVLLALILPGFLKPQMKTVTAPQKGIAHLLLPDGTKVWMKSSSSITYPERFRGKERTVSFNGEGYFEVEASQSSPFIVDAGDFDVIATGTKFDIKAYRDESRAYAALMDGEISIRYSDSSGKECRDNMHTGELAEFDKVRRSNSIMKANTSIYSSWIGGVYSFESERFENIMKEICRYYGYNLIIADEDIKNKVLSGRLKMSDSSDVIIEVFQEFLPGHISFESDTIIIK